LNSIDENNSLRSLPRSHQTRAIGAMGESPKGFRLSLY